MPVPKPKAKRPEHPIKKRRRVEAVCKNEADFHQGVQGRNTLYNPNVHPAIAFYVMFTGGTQAEIAKRSNVSEATILRWKALYPEFAKAVNTRQDHILGDATSALVRRALGYVVEDTEVSHKQHVNKVTGEIIQTQDIKVIRKHVHPDVGAIICLLANRDPSKWRRTDSPLIDLQGKAGQQIAAEIPTEQLEEIVRQSAATVEALTPCYTNWQAVGTEENLAEKLQRMIRHDTEDPS